MYADSDKYRILSVYLALRRPHYCAPFGRTTIIPAALAWRLARIPAYSMPAEQLLAREYHGS